MHYSKVKTNNFIGN